MGGGVLMTSKGRKASEEEIEKAKKKIETVEEFMKDIERVGGKVPKGLKKAVDRYLLAAKLGTDAAEAANEVSKELEKIYQDMYTICREKAGIQPGQPQTVDQANEYMICQARVDRAWQARNVKKVLDWNDDRAWATKVWQKWKFRLLEATGFGDREKEEKNISKEVKGRPILP